MTVRHLEVSLQGPAQSRVSKGSRHSSPITAEMPVETLPRGHLFFSINNTGYEEELHQVSIPRAQLRLS